MKLDMLDALEQATNSLGSSARVYASNVYDGVSVVIECFKSSKHFASQITITHEQLRKDDYNLANQEFKRALASLEKVK